MFHEILCLVGSLRELCLSWLDVLLHLLLYFFDIKELGHLLPLACPSSNLFLFEFLLTFHSFLLFNHLLFIKNLIVIILNKKVGVKRIILFHFFYRSKGFLITVCVTLISILELRIFIVIKEGLFLWKSFILWINIVLLECLVSLVIKERDRF